MGWLEVGGGEKCPECEHTLKPLCNHISLRKLKEMLGGLKNEMDLVRCRSKSTQTLAAVFKNQQREFPF